LPCQLPAYAKYSGGGGEPDDPYQIATAADLIALGESPEDYDKHFLLTAGIDLDPDLPGRKVFDKAIIASDTYPMKNDFQGTPFAGVFDGNRYCHLASDDRGWGISGAVWSIGSQGRGQEPGCVSLSNSALIVLLQR